MIVSSIPVERCQSSPCFQPRQNKWELDRVLPLSHKIPQQYFINAPIGIVDNFHHLLSQDVYSEEDTQVLYDYLLSHRSEMSGDFFAIISRWLEDELKHYQALRRTYRCIAGVSFANMDRIFQQRVHDFKPIEVLLQDEFTILVTLMFDEIGSVYSYRRDLSEYYCHFGSEIRQIGHHLVRDEGTHFSNAAELILLHHARRLGEVESLLGKIVALENSLGKYHKVFFLDHAQE